MQLKIKDGKLSLGTVYKLFVVGWATTWTIIFGFISFLVVISALLDGKVTINGETVYGAGSALLAMAPMFILFPVVIFFQSLIFGALFTTGIWLYRLIRPLDVISEGRTG